MAPRIAEYDWFLGGMAVVAVLVFFIPFKLPPRKRVGIRSGNEKETLEHYLSEADHAFVPIPKTCCGFTFGPVVRCCSPFDWQAWFYLGCMCCMTVPFTMHFVYYFDRLTMGQIEPNTSNTVWLAWGCGIGGAMICTYKGYLYDVGYLFATWITGIIYLIKIVDLSWPAVGEFALVGGLTVVSLLVFSVCVFCGVCGCIALLCTCKCCRDEVSNDVGKLFLWFNMHAAIAITITVGFMVPVNGIAHYRENDRAWLIQSMWVAMVIFVCDVGYTVLLLPMFRCCFEHTHGPPPACCCCPPDLESVKIKTIPKPAPPAAISSKTAPQLVLMNEGPTAPTAGGPAPIKRMQPVRFEADDSAELFSVNSDSDESDTDSETASLRRPARIRNH